jgi:hypothetical protein
MQGYNVVTSDDHKIGHVVDERDECVIVEHGHVFKTRQAIPRDFVSGDDAEQVVHATITKDIFEDGPKVTDDWSCDATLRHFGLVGSFAEPETEDYDETAPAGDSPATGADDSAVARRAAIREGRENDPPPPAVHERSPNAADPIGITANKS